MSNQMVSPPASNHPPSHTEAEPSQEAKVSVDDALHDAFMLGWKIVELKSRVRIALVEPPASGMELASIWRSDFNRIAALQSKGFPKGTTAQTLYDPPGKDILPYLYPDKPDYADVGIRGVAADNTRILESFFLYDVTRRAINCLTLLYVKKNESLIPDDIDAWQTLLIQQILAAGKNPKEGGGDPAADKAIPTLDHTGAGRPDASASQSDNGLEVAKRTLSERIVKFLDAWDGFLRETYYTGGQLPNNEMELVAYEAGRGMSSLSWEVSVATVPLEQGKGPTAAQSDAQSGAKTDPQNNPYAAGWQNVFRDPVVILLQHQISALSASLDDAYYLKFKEKDKDFKRPDDDAVLVTPSPDLPSQAIQAVKHSIDYWQRAVKWIPENTTKLRTDSGAAPGSAAWNKAMRMALTEQANIWQTLMTGQQSLRAYNLESMTQQILQDVMTEIQQNLQTDFGSGVQQAEKVANAIANEAKEALEVVGKNAVNGLETLVQSFVRSFWPLIVGAVVILILAAGLFVAVTMGMHQNALAIGASGGVGVTGILSALLGYLGLNRLNDNKAKQQQAIQDDQRAAKARVDTQTAASTKESAAAGAGNGSLLTRIEGAAQETGNMVLQAFQRGYEQMRIELEGLSRSVGVTYPLVEFCGSRFQLDGDAAFLTEIIWSGTERADEVKQVLRAAFGPLAMFIPLPADE